MDNEQPSAPEMHEHEQGAHAETRQRRRFSFGAIKKKYVLVAVGVIVLGAGGFFAYRYSRDGGFYLPAFIRPEYAQAYTIVPDSISQSANITVTLPPNADKAGAEMKITFTPPIEGAWVPTEAENQLAYRPKNKLKLDRYYTITYASEEGVIGKDFKIAEDPKVLNIFPKADSEAPEDSEITIIFNRPMVPVTTLDELAEYEIPVELKPETPGRFKWSGTRTLQFIPEDTLIASQNYTVTVREGFTSMDGLGVSSFTHSFQTRPLRYMHVSGGQLGYNQPMRVVFNQPVDLARMTAGITVEDTAAKRNVDFKARYGTRREYNRKDDSYEDVVDESIIEIYQARDSHNRKELWDFTKSYYLNIQYAHPTRGDISIEEDRGGLHTVTDVIQSVTAQSDRTSFARPDLFDPTGELVVTFYEDIDLPGSDIDADYLSGITYGEKCKGDEDMVSDSSTVCGKVTDRKKLLLRFEADKLARSQTIAVAFKRIKNAEGLKINPTTIEQKVVVIPQLMVYRTFPADRATNASLTEMIICSNTPLTRPAKEDIATVITASAAYEFESWSNPVLVTPESDQYYECNAFEFQTNISYGLMPRQEYTLTIALEDHFGQRQNLARSFTTGNIPENTLNFFHFQDTYSVTQPDRTKLTYAAVNMEYVNMNICQLNAADMLRRLEDRPDYAEGIDAVSNCTSSVTKRVELPKRYWIKNYFQIDLKEYVGTPNGHYVLTFWHPEYREQWRNSRVIYERNYVSVTNLAVVEKKVGIENARTVYNEETREEYQLRTASMAGLRNLYWVTSVGDLSPVARAQIDLYTDPDDNDQLRLVRTISTDQNGVAQTAPIDRLRGAVVTVGGETAILADAESTVQSAATARDALKLYLYTDRPIYKPGQEVHIKGLYRIGYDGNYDRSEGEVIPLRVFNSQNQEIAKKDLTVNEFGTINTTITLDTKAHLGGYRIEAKGNTASFDVEEYVPSPFKVEARTGKDEYIFGDDMLLNVDADYFFGVPVEGGTVEYGITSQTYFFDKFDEGGFRFGNPWYHCYDGCSFGDAFVLRNSVPLGPSGEVQISQKLDYDAWFGSDEDESSKLLTFFITVRNTNGQSVTTQKSIIVHRGEFYAGIKADRSFAGTDEELTMAVKTVDTEGRSQSVSGMEVTLSKVDWVYYKRQEVDGGYYYKWEKRLEQVSKRTISTNGNGDWSDAFRVKDEGQYELTVRATDNRGNRVQDTYTIYIYGDGQVSVRPTNDTSLDVVTDTAALNVGGSADIIITSPYDRAKALITLERGTVYAYEVVDVNASLYRHRFTVGREHIPNVVASVTLLSADPEIKYGQVAFSVNTEQRELDVAIYPDKERYLPGEEVSLAFEVTNHSGEGVATELSVAVADLSVLALKGNPKKNPIPFFYGGFPHTVATISNIKNILHEVDVPTGTKGGGGLEPDDLAKKKRGVFKDTAFWQAVVRTDASGRARVGFTLPDNLTTWQVESVGITQDTSLGVGYKEFQARKQVMVQPLQPRFVVPGDAFSIGTKVFNQTDTKQKLAVGFESHTLDLSSGKAQEAITLNAGESATVFFRVAAPEALQLGSHAYTVSAKNDQYEDAVDQSVKIRRNDTYETVATAGASPEQVINEYVFVPQSVVPDKGDLTVKHSATLAVFLSDALNSLLAFPHGCSEQVASKLDAMATLKRGLNLKNIGDTFTLDEVQFEGVDYSIDQLVEVGLARLYENQKESGGFSYYPNTNVSAYATLHIANTLKNLQEAGYDVNQDALNRAFNYVNDNVRRDEFKSHDFAIVSAYTAYRIGNPNNVHAFYRTRINQILGDQALLAENMSTMTLTHLALLLSDQEKIFGGRNKEKVYKLLENKIDIDARGAFLPVNRNRIIWDYYETPVKNTAFLLKAFVADERNNEVLDRILRWLLASRAKDGAWGSTNNTISVIDAMTDYFVWLRENESQYELAVSLDGKELSNFSYGPQTILTQNQSSVPVADLKKDELHSVRLAKSNQNNRVNNVYYDVSLKYFLPIEQIPPRDEGFTVTRALYRLEDTEGEQPVTRAAVGEVLRGQLKIIVPQGRTLVAVDDYIPAGVSLINFNLATEDASLREQYGSGGAEDYWYQYDPKESRRLRPDLEELRDDRLFLYVESLPAGEYTYEYFVRAAVPGEFHHLPAVVSEWYFPENFGRTSGGMFTVAEE